MRSEIRRPQAIAASTCARCFKPGTLMPEQNPSTKTLRFECPSGHAWDTDRANAEEHGRFVQRLEGS